MKKGMKKTISLLLALGILLSFSASANGVEVQKDVAREQFEQLLPAIMATPDKFGINSNNIDTLYMGDMIAAYEQTGNSLQTIENKVFPVFCDQQVVGIFTEAITEDGEVFYNYGVEFAKELNEFIKSHGTEISIIYTDEAVYGVAQDGTMTCLQQLTSTASNISKSSLSLERLDISVVEPEKILPVHKISAPTTAAVASGEYKTINVPYVSQRGPVCWAACMASWINYKTGSNLEAYQVVAKCQPNAPSAGASVSQVASYLKKYYGISAYSSNVTLNYTDLYWQINANKAVFFSGYATGSGDARHMVLAYGYYKDLNTLTESFYYMEPNTGFKVGTFTSSGPKFQISAQQTYVQDQAVFLN